MQKQPDQKNILLATIISFIIIILWTWFYEKPRIEKADQLKKQETQIVNNDKASSNLSNSKKDETVKIENNKLDSTTVEISNFIPRDEIIEKSKKQRVKINTAKLHGSINLKGARFDDLTFVDYFEKPKVIKDKITENSIDQNTSNNNEVVLFSPSDSKKRYFADFGWVSSDNKIELPNPQTIWTANLDQLDSQNELLLTWKNNQNIIFNIKITIDENYLFNITQIVKNNSKSTITIASYGRINRLLNNLAQSNYILHEGAIGSIQGILQEKSYEDLVETKEFNIKDSGENGSWLGITDKYWLSAIIPDHNLSYQANFSHNYTNKNNFYNIDFIGAMVDVEQNQELKIQHHLFAGAKKVKLLDHYNEKYNLKLFDRAIDFGWFYFLTKPFFFMIDFFNKFLGNFGLAILAMTVVIKLALFPMANKSYEAIARMKTLQPKIDEIRKRFKDDKMAINREMMELYKREKINPASGCLPVLIQIPVFFALYKVLFVTLDMRHADFYGWINDLSAPDPTSIFNLFGLLPFSVSSTFTVGVWPILMGITMYIQHRLSPPSTDPTQAKILKLMPFVLTFVLAAFPAGLVIYWTWSNVLSIIQQVYINKTLKK